MKQPEPDAVVVLHALAEKHGHTDPARAPMPNPLRDYYLGWLHSRLRAVEKGRTVVVATPPAWNVWRADEADRTQVWAQQQAIKWAKDQGDDE